MEHLNPPPIRRLTGNEDLTERLPTLAPAPPEVNGHGNGTEHDLTNGTPAERDHADTAVLDRLAVETTAVLERANPSAVAPAPALGARRQARRQHPMDAPLALDRMQISDLSVAYGRKLAVDGVSLPIRQGEVLGLIGPSGCGKTTLLRSLNRLTELSRDVRLQGQITLDEVDIARLDPTALRRRVTMVFQQPNPFPMSVFDNVAYVLREQAARRPRRSALRGAVREALSRAGLLDELGDDLDHPALRLSGGQQQRLCIARALAADPEVLLLDEPCSALDPQSTAVIEELIVKLREDVAVVIVTHNLQQAYRVADYVGFMYLGQLVEYGSATQLFRQPREQRTKEYVRGDFG
jgi:phosphate transport system ATP-binding protein